MGGEVPFHLLDSEIAIQHVSSSRYTQTFALPRIAGGRDHGTVPLQYSLFNYQYASVHAARLASLDPIYNSSEAPGVLAQLQPPAEYHVCVAVLKTPSTTSNVAETAVASQRLLALWGATVPVGSNSSSSKRRSPPASANVIDTANLPEFSAAASDRSSSNDTATVFFPSIGERLAARTSVSPAGAAVRAYTAVPGLQAHLVPPPVSIKGMWALPPRRLSRLRAWSIGGSGSPSSAASAAELSWVTLVPAAATHNRSAHYLLRTHCTYNSADPTSPSSPLTASRSTAHLQIPQYSSPIILLDGHNAQRGMLALLSQDPNSCNRRQPLPRDDPTRAAAAWPHRLDTIVPLSTITMTVEGSGTATATVTTMAYMQLSLNHTGL
ncbi:hypothetical protein JIQ42_07167 [Leishmania sp. Namibia]|uniref:hypothetical protein n=1 Tax=Leishmania sp. Namibia TaxID=2802991 RepID=UPI001B40FAC5|nr:hypothetical protein JIQ42_07167 [Leishmania sp. Namibia]